MGIPNLDYINQNSFDIIHQKGQQVNALALVLNMSMNNYWLITPNAGAIPPSYSGGTGTFICDGNTTGGLLNPIYPTGYGSNLYFSKWTHPHETLTIGNYILYDRIWTCSSFNSNTTGIQTITNFGILPSRDMYGSSSGFGLEMWIEDYVASSSLVQTFTVTYTDAYGNSGCTAAVSKSANPIGVGIMLPLYQSSGIGIASIQSLQLTATGTSDNLGITLLRRIAQSKSINPIIPKDRYLNGIEMGLPIIYPNSCLAIAQMINTSSTSNLTPQHIFKFTKG